MSYMNFDLNIKNYKLSELEEIFQLNDKYDINSVNTQEKKLIESVEGNRDMTNDLKDKTVDFLARAKKIIISGIKEVKDLNESFTMNKKFVHYNTYDLGETKIDAASGNHDMQVRGKTTYANSNVREFLPGTVNPLGRSVVRQYLNVDTRFRDNYYTTQSSNFTVTLPTKFYSVLSMQLTALEIPLSFYNISKQHGNNFFQISTDGSNAMIAVPSGNYSVDILINYINTVLTNLGGDFAKIFFMFNITSSTSGSGQIVVGISSPNTLFNFTLNFQTDVNGNPDYNTPLPLKLGWMLGFREGMYVNNSTYVTEAISSMVGPRYIYLVIDDFNNNVINGFYGAFTNSIINKNILARITLTATTFQEMSQNNLITTTLPRQYMGPVNLERMNIQLLDEYGRILDLNNMDYSFNLLIHTEYDF